MRAGIFNQAFLELHCQLDCHKWQRGFSGMWVWVKIKPPGIGPHILVLVSIYQGKPFGCGSKKGPPNGLPWQVETWTKTSGPTPGGFSF